MSNLEHQRGYGMDINSGTTYTLGPQGGNHLLTNQGSVYDMRDNPLTAATIRVRNQSLWGEQTGRDLTDPDHSTPTIVTLKNNYLTYATEFDFAGLSVFDASHVNLRGIWMVEPSSAGSRGFDGGGGLEGRAARSEIRLHDAATLWLWGILFTLDGASPPAATPIAESYITRGQRMNLAYIPVNAGAQGFNSISLIVDTNWTGSITWFNVPTEP